MKMRVALRWSVWLCAALGMAGSLSIIGVNKFSSATEQRHYKIDGGSMVPTFDVGEVITVGTTQSPQVGDVVTFLHGDKITTHRVARTWNSKTPDGELRTMYATRGDANAHEDPWVVTENEIVGTVLPTSLPVMVAVELTEHPVVLALLFLPLLLNLFVTEMNTVWTLVRGDDDEECPERESNPQDVAIRGV